MSRVVSSLMQRAKVIATKNKVFSDSSRISQVTASSNR